MIAEELEKHPGATETKLAVKSQLTPFEDQVAEWKEKAFAIVVSDVNDKETIGQAEEGLKIISKVRRDVEARRKELKEDSLRRGQLIDACANMIKREIEPIESHLQLQAEFVKRHEETQRQLKYTQRIDKIKAADPDMDINSIAGLADLDDQAFSFMLMGIGAQAEQRKANDAELARLQAQQDAEAKEERERVAEENKRLKDELERKAAIEKLASARESELRSLEGYIAGQVAGLGTMTNFEFRDTLTHFEKHAQAVRSERLAKEAEDKRIRDENARLLKEKADKEQADKKAQDEKRKADLKAKRAPDKEKTLEWAASGIEWLNTFPKLKDEHTKNMVWMTYINIEKEIQNLTKAAESL